MVSQNQNILDSVFDNLRQINPVKFIGTVEKVIGLVIESKGPIAAINELCYIISEKNKTRVPAEVVGFRQDKTLLMPLGEMRGLNPGDLVQATRHTLEVRVDDSMLGRVLNGLGEPTDNKAPFHSDEKVSIYNTPPDPMSRARVTKVIATGIRAIDGFLTTGQGQRFGIFAGSGVGKSVLLGMMAKYSDADVNVIGLIGERGREVRDFLERDLGDEGLKRSVVVVATSDQPALVRIKGAFVTLAIAEYFRDKGKKVNLMMDSVTRLAMAQREVGLAIGEPPTTRGYTPSVFAMLPKLLERAGNSDKGSITGFFTTLVEGDDMNEPVADAVRSILDGHIVLSRQLAALNHYPAIDILSSVSRVMTDVATEEHINSANYLRSQLAVYKEAEDLINVGAYNPGSNPRIDNAIKWNESINRFLRQQRNEHDSFEDSVERLTSIASAAQGGKDG